jgi:hypothetical protein
MRTMARRQLANQILPVFSSREVHREAMAALLLYQQASWEDRLVPPLLVQLAALLERERRPSLACWAAASSIPPMRATRPMGPPGRTGDARRRQDGQGPSLSEPLAQDGGPSTSRRHRPGAARAAAAARVPEAYGWYAACGPGGA